MLPAPANKRTTIGTVRRLDRLVRIVIGGALHAQR
jgi:hypothetical protein